MQPYSNARLNDVVKYALKFASKDLDESIDFLAEVIKDATEIMLLTKDLTEGEISKSQHLLYQQVLRRTSSIIDLSKNTLFLEKSLPDVSSTFVIARANYEAILLAASFGLKREKSEIELLRFFAWRISALKERRRASNIPEDVLLGIQEQINLLEKRIEGLKLYEPNKDEIDRAIKKKKYHFTMNGDKVVMGNWTVWEFEELKGSMLLLQCHGHPSEIAIENFSRIYYDPVYSELLSVIKMSIVFLCSAAYVSMRVSDKFLPNDFCMLCSYLTRKGNIFHFSPQSEKEE